MLRKEQESLQEKLRYIQVQASKDKKQYDASIAVIKNDCFRQIQEAERHCEEVESRCTKDNEAAANAKAEAEKYRKKHKLLLQNEQSKIDSLAEEKIADTKASLQASKDKEIRAIKEASQNKIEKYKNKYAKEYAAKETWHITSFGFCILWLIIQALSSNYFRKEFITLITGISEYGTISIDTIIDWSTKAGSIISNIENQIISTILFWIIAVLVGLILLLFFLGIPIAVIGGGSILYIKSKYYDTINRWFMVGSAILFIAVSSEMFYQPKINLLLLWIILQVVIPLIRFIIIPFTLNLIEKWKEMYPDERKNVICNIAMILLVIGGFIFIIFLMRSCAATLSNI